MATANPTQLYEKVSEEEALSRNDQLDGQMIYQVSQEEALSRSARYAYYGKGQLTGPGQVQQQRRRCEKYCWWSAIQKRYICEYWCPRK